MKLWVFPIDLCMVEGKNVKKGFILPINNRSPNFYFWDIFVSFCVKMTELGAYFCPID